MATNCIAHWICDLKMQILYVRLLLDSAESMNKGESGFSNQVQVVINYWGLRKMLPNFASKVTVTLDKFASLGSRPRFSSGVKLNLVPYEMNNAVRHGWTSSTLNWCKADLSVQMQNTSLSIPQFHQSIEEYLNMSY
ncbi:hypothetical protein CRYUN_Cryun01aG0215800 [Craigia yunnanensis]